MTDLLSDIFKDEKDWLQKQPGMESWTDGCRMLERIFDSILAENREKLFEVAVDETHPLRYDYFARLWTCQFYHWERCLRNEPSISARRVVDDIKLQYKENNVFDHVVLAAATVRNEKKAYLLFYDFYCDMFRRVAVKRGIQRVGIENQDDDHKEANQDDCRESILDKLIGPPEKEAANRVRNARLESYRGHGSFKRWIYTAVDRLVSSYLTNFTPIPVPNDSPAPQPSEDVQHLHEVVKTLTEEDRYLIELYYYEQKSLEEIGRSLPESRDKSTVQRRIKAVLARIRERWNTVDSM